jgi:N-acetylmuramoyl-L-alanine amidase
MAHGSPPKGRGWKEIGYHFLVQPSGEIQAGRSVDEIGAHVQGHNEGNVGVCLIGTDAFPDDQLLALRKLVQVLLKQFGIPAWEIYCHYEFDTARAQGKTCPNLGIKPLLVWLISGDASAKEALQELKS